MTKLLFGTAGCTTDVINDELFSDKQLSVSILRLDKMHATVPGNKLFKLHYFLEQAIASTHKHIITFGGAYSNHLLATAYACKELSLRCTGVVRGEAPARLSPTLQECMGLGMQLKFIAREAYDKKGDPLFIASLLEEYGEATVVPEGGYHVLGAKGAALIMDMADAALYTHIVTAVGTATTLAGLLTAAKDSQQVVGVPVLKGMTDIESRIAFLTGNEAPHNLQLLQGYHFGGYAKHTAELLTFMNHCWSTYTLPLDVVYTAKMFYAVTEAIKKNHFPGGSRILCLHTGGLQGNRSLSTGTLLY